MRAGRQVAWLREEQRALVRALRPDAVALTDAFGYPDYQLNSALGRKDGDVYRVRRGRMGGDGTALWLWQWVAELC